MRYQIIIKEQNQKRSNGWKSKSHLRKLWQPLGTRHIQCPRRRISSSKAEGKEYVREWEYKKERRKKKESLTSSEETAEP
jgi:hypothetical protein